MSKKEHQQFFQDIIDQHKGILYKVARIYCQNEEDRQDLIQEMMIQIWQSIHKYNSQFKISTWIYRISLNVAISYYRKSKTITSNQSFLEDQSAQQLSDDKTEREQQLNLLEQFVSELREIDKALMLLYLEDKSYNEIAEVLGMSVSNVGTKIGRIKDKLKIRFSQINQSYHGRN